MERFVYYVLGFLALLFVLSTCNVVRADPMVVEMFEPSVQLGDYCSGEIIHSKKNEKTGKVATIVLTAKHCVKNLSTTDIVPINKSVYDNHNRKTGVKTYLSNVIGKSFKSDLAVLKLRDQETLFDNVASVAPSDTPLVFGQDVSLVGYPMGHSMTYTTGKLGYVEDGIFTDVSSSRQFYRATPDLAPGSSGSSMFTIVDGKYKIIGIATGGFINYTFMNFFTPVEEINEYLDVVSKTYDKEEE